MPNFSLEDRYEDGKVPEGLKDLYQKEEEDGKTVYVVREDVKKAFSGDELKEENSRLRKEISSRPAPSSAPKEEKEEEEIKKISDSVKSDVEKISSKDKVLFSKLEKKIGFLEKKLEEEGKKREALLESNISTKKRYLIEGTIKKHGGVPELLYNIVDKKVGIEDKAKFEGINDLYVYDDKGEVDFVGSQKKTVDDLVIELKQDEKYGMAFKKVGQSVGTNEKDSSLGETLIKKSPKDFGNLTLADQVKIAKKDPKYYASAMQDHYKEKISSLKKLYEQNSLERNNLI